MSLPREVDARARRSGLKALAGAAVLGVLVVSQAAVAAPIKVKAGHLVALDMAPLFVAKEAGCFEKHGLDVEPVFFANPGDNNAALAGGAIDFSINPFTLPFFAANSNVPIRVIAAAGGWGAWKCCRGRKLGVKSIADMQATSRPTPASKAQGRHAAGRHAGADSHALFEKQGIDPAKIEFVYFNDLLAMVEAFRSGKVDILSHIKPYTTDLEGKGRRCSPPTPRRWSPTTPNCVVSVLDKTLTETARDRREVYLESLAGPAEIINTNPEKAVEPC